MVHSPRQQIAAPNNAPPGARYKCRNVSVDGVATILAVSRRRACTISSCARTYLRLRTTSSTLEAQRTIVRQVRSARTRQGTPIAPTTTMSLLTAIPVAIQLVEQRVHRTFELRRAIRATKMEIALHIKKQALPLTLPHIRSIASDTTVHAKVRKASAVVTSPRGCITLSDKSIDRTMKTVHSFEVSRGAKFSPRSVAKLAGGATYIIYILDLSPAFASQPLRELLRQIARAVTRRCDWDEQHEFSRTTIETVCTEVRSLVKMGSTPNDVAPFEKTFATEVVSQSGAISGTFESGCQSAHIFFKELACILSALLAARAGFRSAFVWTDNTAAIYTARSGRSSNRIASRWLQECIGRLPSHFCYAISYVPSSQNPADIWTRVWKGLRWGEVLR